MPLIELIENVTCHKVIKIGLRQIVLGASAKELDVRLLNLSIMLFQPESITDF